MQSERHNSVKIELIIDHKAQEGIIVWIDPIPTAMTSTTSNTSKDSSLFSWSCQLSDINFTLQFSEGLSFLTTAFNIEHWNFYLSDYSDATVTKFL